MRESLSNLLKKRPDLLSLQIDVPTGALHLNTVGSRVRVRPGKENVPADAGLEFTVSASVVVGADEFVTLKDSLGGLHRWYKASDLLTVTPPKETPPMSNAMETEQQLHAAADQFEAAVNKRIARGQRPDEALLGEATDDPVRAEIYRRSKTGSNASSTSSPVISLSVRSGETFDQLAMRYANERGVSLRQAVHEVGVAFPQLAAAR